MARANGSRKAGQPEPARKKKPIIMDEHRLTAEVLTMSREELYRHFDVPMPPEEEVSEAPADSIPTPAPT